MPPPSVSPTSQAGRRGLATELVRARWLSAAALITIAITVFTIALLTARAPENADRIGWIGTLVVCAEVLVALVGTSWLSRQILRQTRDLEAQRAELETQAAKSRDEARNKARLVALLDGALGGSPVAFGFFDRDLRFLRVNPTFAEITGRAPEDHIGCTLKEIHAWLAKDVEPMMRRVLSTREPIKHVEIVGPAPRTQGPRPTWLASGFPIITADGEMFGAGIVVTDLTEFKRLEEQFLQAQKMEAVGRLAGGVAHDFNNLLTVISSYAELILFDPSMQQSKGEIEEIRGAAARAAKLTRQLLAFSRRQALEPRIVNPNDVLRGVEQLMRGLMLGNIQIETRLAPNTPLIRVDPSQLEQVVMNLTINAADAMPEGGLLGIETANVELADEVKRWDPDMLPGSYAMIRVRDTGHGMTKEVIEQIFEPFFTTKEPGRGTGLGLSTAYGIVKQSGGHIEVESTVGTGTEFTVYLPAVGQSP